MTLIEKSLSRVPGISNAVVNLATEKATVTYDSDTCSEEQIASAVSNVGYKVVMDEELGSQDDEKMEKEKELKKVFKLQGNIFTCWDIKRSNFKKGFS